MTPGGTFPVSSSTESTSTRPSRAISIHTPQRSKSTGVAITVSERSGASGRLAA